MKKLGGKINGFLDALMDRMDASIRVKLIMIFLIIKIVPLVVLLIIVWNHFGHLGDDVRQRTNILTDEMTTTITDAGNLAVTDSTNALIANAVEQIERITTDTANAMADFLYQRDNDILYLATIEPTEAAYRNFIDGKKGLLTDQGIWDLAADGMSWERKDQPEPAVPGDVSTNPENEEKLNETGFHYRPAETQTYTNVPYYDEISFIGTDLMEQFKIVSDFSTKRHFPVAKDPKDISAKANTYIGAEDYGSALSQLKPGEIYVSDVIGSYVPSRFIGMYTPKQMILSAVNTEITALAALENQTEETAALTKNLGVVASNSIPAIDVSGSALDARQPNAPAFADQQTCTKIMKQTADAALTLIDEAAAGVETPEMRERVDALKTKIVGLTFDPSAEAFAGEENPLGQRFEGIVRWATPVTRDGQIIGYVSFALNHDHIMEFTDHITPMNERYTELSSAFEGNYAFVWDYQCRNICHSRHHSIVGYDPKSGVEQIPWLETPIYDGLLEKIDGSSLADLQANWPELINDPQTPDKDYAGVDNLLPDVTVFDVQSRSKKPAPALTAAGLVGLDGRYLNNAPQCTGWMDLTSEGGSGSFYILWSGLWKLTTAAAIPYYTGQYAPSENNGFSERGFAMVTVGAGLEDFRQPAEDTAATLDDIVTQANASITLAADETQQTITSNMSGTTLQLSIATGIIIVLVILIAIWTASFIAGNITILVGGLTRFRLGNRRFRFNTTRTDEFGELADSFDSMADNIENSTTSPLSITDLNLNIIYMNDLGVEATNRNHEETSGKSYKEYSIYPFGSKYCPITALEKGTSSEVYYNERNGKYYKGRASYLFDKNGDPIGYIIMSTDMTDASLNHIRLEQAVEEANRANEYKGQFLARMSHEIRTPMNAIIGITNIVEKKLDEYKDPTSELHEIKEHVSQIENSSQHLLGLLNDILDLSKIEAGKIELSQERVNLSNLAQTVKTIIQPRCDMKRIIFDMDMDAALTNAHYVTDALRLRQVLINLLGNAVKFTPDLGNIRFEIRKLSGTDHSDMLHFTIADTGIGIEENALSNIFDPFEQGDGSITRQYGGTGLGLPISRNIIRLLGGDIEVSSEIGKGSVFRFVLEMEKVSADQKEIKANDSCAADFSDKRILVVDDVDINRMIIINQLEYTGIEILEASDGEQALKLFRESTDGSIDIILMDVMMPVMNGLEAAEAIRKLKRKDAKTIPIIALTANAFKEDVDKAIASGMNAHQAKPIDANSLIMILRNFLANETS